MTAFGDDALAFCNTRTRTVEGTVPVGRAPWGVAWRPGGDRVFVTNRKDDTVSVVDVVARTVVATIPVGSQPLGIAMHPFLPRAYVASYGGDRVDVVDTDALAVVDRIPVGDGPAGVAVHPAGATLFVANYIAGTVSAVDLATGIAPPMEGKPRAHGRSAATRPPGAVRTARPEPPCRSAGVPRCRPPGRRASTPP